MRGFAAIGLVRPKNQINVGSVLRAAHCYDASLVLLESPRCEVKSSTDTHKSWRDIPVQRVGDLHSCIPYDCVPIAVDLVDDAQPLFEFEHPQRGFYVFGPEDGTLGRAHLKWCKHKIMIPTRSCMNLAATVNVVLYDRALKASVRNDALCA